LLPLNATFDLLNIEICIVEHLWKQLIVLILNIVFVEDLVRYLCLEQLGVMICIKKSCYQQKLHIDVPGLSDGSEQISCMNRQIITFVVVHCTLEVAEESWVKEILCLIELLNYLVDRVEFEELLGHVVGHSKVPSVNYHDLLIKLRELQFLQELQDASSLTFEEISLMKCVDNLIFVDKELLEGRVVCLKLDILDFHLYEQRLPFTGSGRGQLLRDRKLWLVSTRRLIKLDIVFPLDLDVLRVEPNLADDDLLHHLEDQPTKVDVLRKIKLEGPCHIVHL
jgi:hypothetical protein